MTDKYAGRKGDWIQLRSSERFYPLDPRPEEVKIEDIAHSLSNICRFTGHSSSFYSVAQHSVLVSQLAPNKEQALWFLLHDAPEAYISDINRTIKKFLYVNLQDDYYEHVEIVEKRLMKCIATALNLPPNPDWKAIKVADNRLLATEARDLMTLNTDVWGKWIENVEMLPDPIIPCYPKLAKSMFLERYNELKNEVLLPAIVS